ncbi:hypothetical protein NXS19_011761 [Fusarium pseudograminearum]|nr:hypothetical protein NXS19_011761 [Fusarium pseudograminearum]
MMRQDCFQKLFWVTRSVNVAVHFDAGSRISNTSLRTTREQKAHASPSTNGKRGMMDPGAHQASNIGVDTIFPRIIKDSTSVQTRYLVSRPKPTNCFDLLLQNSFPSRQISPLIAFPI